MYFGSYITVFFNKQHSIFIYRWLFVYGQFYKDKQINDRENKNICDSNWNVQCSSFNTVRTDFDYWIQRHLWLTIMFHLFCCNTSRFQTWTTLFKTMITTAQPRAATGAREEGGFLLLFIHYILWTLQWSTWGQRCVEAVKNMWLSYSSPRMSIYTQWIQRRTRGLGN